LNRLNKTKEEDPKPDLRGQREARDDAERAKKKADNKDKEKNDKLQERQQVEEKAKLDELKSYKTLMESSSGHTNQEMGQKYKSARDAEEDFM